MAECLLAAAGLAAVRLAACWRTITIDIPAGEQVRRQPL